MKKRVVSLIIACLCIISCSSNKVEKEKVEVVAPYVRLEKAYIQNVNQIQEFVATVNPDISNSITPASPTRIKNIFVEIGDFVSKNQKIAQMDASNLNKLKIQLENQKTEFTRIQELYEVGGVSRSEFDQMKMNLEVLETSYDNQLENTWLISPINGVITERNYDKGDMFVSSKPIVVIEKTDVVKLLIHVPESYFSKIKKNAKVEVNIDALEKKLYEGYVSLIYPKINTQTRTFSVEISVPNTSRKICSGMFAKVKVNFESIPRVIVSDSAVTKQMGSGDYYIYKDKQVYLRKVEIGIQLDDKYEIISGLNDGEQVVVAGTSRLSDKLEVRVKG